MLFIKSSHSNISDISELKSSDKFKSGDRIKSEIISENAAKIEAMPVESKRVAVTEKNSGGLFEYLANRKYYIIVLSAVYILGVVIGAMLINSLELAEVINLSSIVDNYFTGLPAINMTARILGNIAVSLAFIFGAYLSGVTIFAPLVCCAFSLYKGLSAGFITGVYIIGGGTSFHSAVCIFNFMLNLFAVLFFILICAEAMSFSSFLFKNEESFKSSMSFKNISVYSSRFMLLTLLTALATFVQTIAVPLVYAWIG